MRIAQMEAISLAQQIELATQSTVSPYFGGKPATRYLSDGITVDYAGSAWKWSDCKIAFLYWSQILD